MTDSRKHLDFQEEISGIRAHQKEGLERIEDWYTTASERRVDRTGLKEPPHEALRERAEALVGMAVEVKAQNRGLLGTPTSPSEIHDILLGIGTEVLLNAIVLEKDSEYFLANTSDNRTPSFHDCRSKMMNHLPAELGERERDRIEDVLEVVWLHRNNMVHFGFHEKRHGSHEPEIYRVLAFLLDFFFDTAEIVDRLESRREKLEAINTGMNHPDMDFSVDS